MIGREWNEAGLAAWERPVERVAAEPTFEALAADPEDAGLAEREDPAGLFTEEEARELEAAEFGEHGAAGA